MQLSNEASDFLWDVQGNFPKMIEPIEEIIQGFNKFSFGEAWEELKKGFGLLWQKMQGDFSVSLEDTVCRVSYFIGNLVGFVIELVAEAYLTGGTAAVASLVRKMGSFGKVLEGSLIKFVGKLARPKDGVLFASLNQLSDFLSTAPARMKEFIQDAFQAMGK